MSYLLTISRYTAVLFPALVLVVTGCTQSGQYGKLSQESLGIGIVSGTLGEQQRVALCVGESSSISVVGQVHTLEGGAYLVRDAKGQEIRIPHDENTRIDRSAHVGDRIQSWLDRNGRAVFIRILDEPGQQYASRLRREGQWPEDHDWSFHADAPSDAQRHEAAWALLEYRR